MASLFEQYENAVANSSLPSYNSSGYNNKDRNEGIINLKASSEEPIFQKYKIDFTPASDITHMVASNNQLLLAMANKTLLKIDQMNPKTPLEIDLNQLLTGPKSKQSQIQNIFIDSTGRHCLVTLATQDSPTSEPTPYENVYFTSKKPFQLTKLRGFIITSVGWNLQMSTADSSTGNILVGTHDGKIFETQLQPDDRLLSSKEVFIKQVADIASLNSAGNDSVACDGNAMLTSGEPTSICAMTWFRSSSHHYCIFVATRKMLYCYAGSAVANENGLPYLTHIFQNPVGKHYKEMPGYIHTTKLDFFWTGARPKAFGWLTRPGIFYGDIPNDLNESNCVQMFDNATLIRFNLGSDTQSSSLSSENEVPLSLILTRFHLLLLYPEGMRVVCVLNQRVIHEERYSGTYGRALGICKDQVKGVIWVYTNRAVYRYKVVKEERNIWQIYLAKKDFNMARHFAKDDIVKLDQTICEEALHLFGKGELRQSAYLFASTKSKSFEEIALKFIELHDTNQEALREYLLAKLRNISMAKERTQAIILLLWLIEIMLNQLATKKVEMEDKLIEKKVLNTLEAEYRKMEDEFKTILADGSYRAILKMGKTIIYNLIMNHGNQSILIYFAELIDDFDMLIDLYLQQAEHAKALEILRKEECLTLYYKYSPVLVKELPGELVAQLMPLASKIDFGKLIPALVHFDHSIDSGAGTEEAKLKRQTQCKEILKFLKFCVFNMETSSSVVHNYLLALYAQYEPDQLLSYLQSKGQDETSVPYDLRYAARLCIQLNLAEATVHLLATMGAYEEAVEHALANKDVDLAKQTAERIQNDKPELAKRLWLKIAKYVIKNIYISREGEEREGGDNQFTIKMATSILNECPLLKIEDILPYFPEFLTIDHFKEAICASLESYNRNIEELRNDMRMATDSAKDIREEIVRLRNRFTVVKAGDKCGLCGHHILMRPFYSFHCGHLFHSDCMLDEVRPQLSEGDKLKLQELESSLSKLQITTGGNQPSSARGNNISEANQREEMYAKIDDIVAAECLWCGQFMINLIDKPFIHAKEMSYALKGWL